MPDRLKAELAKLDAREGYLLALVLVELGRARQKYPPMCTPHHGHGVILEELEEAWDEIKANKPLRAVEEIMQVASSAIRFLFDDPFSAEARRVEEWEQEKARA